MSPREAGNPEGSQRQKGISGRQPFLRIRAAQVSSRAREVVHGDAAVLSAWFLGCWIRHASRGQRHRPSRRQQRCRSRRLKRSPQRQDLSTKGSARGADTVRATLSTGASHTTPISRRGIAQTLFQAARHRGHFRHLPVQNRPTARANAWPADVPCRWSEKSTAAWRDDWWIEDVLFTERSG